MTFDPNATQNSGDDDLDLVNSTQADVVRMEQDIDELSDIVHSNPSLLGGEDVAELLQRLANAENMAEGMENKIDNVLQNLDKLLGILDNTDTTNADNASNISARESGVVATSVGDHSDKQKDSSS